MLMVRAMSHRAIGFVSLLLGKLDVAIPPLEVIERVEREPYEGAEYPSRRSYLVALAT
jgi:hypothetical protein